MSLTQGVSPAMFAEIAPQRVCMTLLPLGYDLGMGLLGGTAPLTASYIISETGLTKLPWKIWHTTSSGPNFPRKMWGRC